MRFWQGYLAVSLLGIIGYWALPAGGMLQAKVFMAVAIGCTAAVAIAAVRMSGSERLLWSLMGLGMAMYGFGYVLDYVLPVATNIPIPFPSVADAICLGADGVWLVGLSFVVVRRSRGRLALTVLDGALVTAGLAALSYTFLIGPILDAGGASAAAVGVSAAYPVIDLALLGALVCLMLFRQGRNPVLWLLVLFIASQLVGDTAVSRLTLDGTFQFGSWPMSCWLLAYAFLATAALRVRAGSAACSPVRKSSPSGVGRIVVLGLVGLIVPGVLVGTSIVDDGLSFLDIGVLAGLAAAISGLTVIRMSASMHALQRAEQASRDVSLVSVRGEESFRSVFEDNPQPMFVWDPTAYRIGDPTWKLLAVNRSALALYGYEREEFLALSARDLRADVRRTPLPDLIAAVDGVPHFNGIQHRTKSGRLLDVEIDVRPATFDGHSAKIICTRDITQRVRLQAELERQAFHDGLTGLPNRALFNDRLEHAHRRLQQSAGLYAVLMLDLDNFKSVNDSLGHGAGDVLLVEVAQRLSRRMRPGDTIARLGGDEFAVLLEDLLDESAATAAAERLHSVLLEPFYVEGRDMTVTATVGVACVRDADAPADVVRNADVAMYVGKAGGKNQNGLFSEHMHVAAMERLTMEQDLRRGVGGGELMLQYQPKIDAQSGRLTGVEALVRWNHPTRGLVPPNAFIPLAEQTGLINDVDHWVLREACRQARVWSTSPVGPIPVAVNVSGKDLAVGRLLTQVQAALAESSLDPHLLELEITESAAIPQDIEAMRLLEKLRHLGVKIAIDDFGTGYSVLSRLHSYPLDTLKIDLSFVRAITKNGDEAPIVDAMIAMGLSLGLSVVAEGVETEVQRAYLTKKGCSQLQGYLISRPVGADQLAAWVEKTFGPSRNAVAVGAGVRS